MGNTVKFNNARVDGCVTVVGDKQVNFLESHSEYGLDQKEAKRVAKVMGLRNRRIVSDDATTSDLCLAASRNLLKALSINPERLSGLIFVSQTPDFASPATAVWLQHQLGLPTSSVCFDIRLGCSGFVYGLSVAYSLIESGLDVVLLCVGDVASKIVDGADHTVAPIMGDAGSAILVSRSEDCKSIFQLYSDGSGYDALIIPNSGIRREKRYANEDPNLIMNGAAVFDFTLKQVAPAIDSILAEAKLTPEDLDYFVLHQPNRYMLQNIKKRLKVNPEKVPDSTQSEFGNQNSASIPGTINGFLSQEYSGRRLKSVFCGFGVGISWGACIVETDQIYCPEPLIHGESHEDR